MRTCTLILAALALSFAPAEEASPWKQLFDGETLDGWRQLNGKATYEVVDGALVGTTVLGSPNSFLCTRSHYDDFILELEYQVDPKLNSGVQIRSNSYPEYRNGRVHGYQVEIDPSDRAWSAGIYDEAGRGWLHDLADNPKAREAFAPEGWNHYRIEAVGDTLKTWINGVPATHLVDTQTRSGFIGLQVHGIGKDKEKEGIQVRWRNLRIIDENVVAHTRPTPLPPHDLFNKLGTNEAAWGWQLLWDGETTAGWRGAKLEGFPESGWVVRDRALTVLQSGGGESAAGGDIVTTQKYSDFELCVDFKLTPGANSGIKYFVDTELNQGAGSAIGLEYQLLDDARHPDAGKGNHAGSRTLASLYDLIEARGKAPRPIGEWNHARIVSKGEHVEHWLNGRRVLQYERKSPAYRQLVAESKYKDWPSFGELPEGQLLLQDHGDHVSFRNIKIRVPK